MISRGFVVVETSSTRRYGGSTTYATEPSVQTPRHRPGELFVFGGDRERRRVERAHRLAELARDEAGIVREAGIVDDRAGEERARAARREDVHPLV